MDRKLTTSACANCDVSFSHRADHPNKFCSRSCAGMSRRHKVNCRICGIRVKQSRNVYCSNKCAALARTDRTTKTMMCDACGAVFSRPQCHVSKTNFCSRECHGMHQSEHRAGKNHPRSRPIGFIMVRTDSSKRKRAWIKLAHPHAWEQHSRYIWRTHWAREIPRGHVIHHTNGDTTDDRPENLQCVPRSRHMDIHREELDNGKQK